MQIEVRGCEPGFDVVGEGALHGLVEVRDREGGDVWEPLVAGYVESWRVVSGGLDEYF